MRGLVNLALSAIVLVALVDAQCSDPSPCGVNTNCNVSIISILSLLFKCAKYFYNVFK
jgi:hypothetical protein